MKKEYLKPEIEISVFATEDIITASSTGLTKGADLDNTTTGGVPYDDIF